MRRGTHTNIHNQIKQRNSIFVKQNRFGFFYFIWHLHFSTPKLVKSQNWIVWTDRRYLRKSFFLNAHIQIKREPYEFCLYKKALQIILLFSGRTYQLQDVFTHDHFLLHFWRALFQCPHSKNDFSSWRFILNDSIVHQELLFSFCFGFNLSFPTYNFMWKFSKVIFFNWFSVFFFALSAFDWLSLFKNSFVWAFLISVNDDAIYLWHTEKFSNKSNLIQVRHAVFF